MNTISSLKPFAKRLLLPQNVGLILMLTFGIVFMFLIKPLQTPDEASHFIRAYELSEGKLFATKNIKAGCVQQDNTISYKTSMSQSSMPTSVANFVDLNRDDYSERAQLKVHLNPAVQTSVCATQIEANSPVGYIPQVIAILLLKPFNAPPILMDYLARLFILAAWTAFIYYAIKIIPVRKWTIVAIAILPIAIQQSISIGADVLSIAPTALFIAYVIRSYYEDRSKYVRRDLPILALLAAIATLSKPVTIVLVLMIPFHYAKTSKKVTIHHVKLVTVVAIMLPVLAYLTFSILAAHNHASADDVFKVAQIKAQYFKHSKFSELRVFARETVNYVLYSLSLNQFGSFKWFTVEIPQTFSYYGLVILSLVLLVSYDDKKVLPTVSSKRVNWLNVAVVCTALGMLAASILSLFIIWTPLGSFAVQGIQFRYFLPILMVAACVVGTKFLRSSERWYRNLVLLNASGLFIISVCALTGALLSV